MGITHRAVSPVILLTLVVGLRLSLRAQEPARSVGELPVALQPLAQHLRRLETALRYLGQPPAAAEHQAINDAMSLADELNAVNQCWTQKASQIRAGEVDDARKVGDNARAVYRQRLAEMEQ
jgi:hypothetical protein